MGAQTRIFCGPNGVRFILADKEVFNVNFRKNMPGCYVRVFHLREFIASMHCVFGNYEQVAIRAIR